MEGKKLTLLGRVSLQPDTFFGISPNATQFKICPDVIPINTVVWMYQQLDSGKY